MGACHLLKEGRVHWCCHWRVIDSISNHKGGKVGNTNCHFTPNRVKWRCCHCVEWPWPTKKMTQHSFKCNKGNVFTEIIYYSLQIHVLVYESILPSAILPKNVLGNSNWLYHSVNSPIVNHKITLKERTTVHCPSTHFVPWSNMYIHLTNTYHSPYCTTIQSYCAKLQKR
jgi:hypothetical protein